MYVVLDQKQTAITTYKVTELNVDPLTPILSAFGVA